MSEDEVARLRGRSFPALGSATAGRLWR